jgi:wyosine [tRNA(Phe)-imidazoG37] synthetase (radical SAM superfamily)
MQQVRSFSLHPRNWREFKWCYPVIARRSKGLSLGINLNPDRVCNFDCIYCEVSRSDFRLGEGKIRLPPLEQLVNLEEIRHELDQLLRLVREGQIWQETEFSTVPLELQRLNDIAFSGDGEPTTYPRFSEAVQLAIEARAGVGYTPEEVKIVLITNATQLHRPQVQAGLRLLDQANGEIWAKLDAGTPEYYELVDQTNVPYKRVLNNILETARQQPINIQTCLMRVQDEAPTKAEIEAYCGRLSDFLVGGGQIKMVQLYTVARRPPNQWVTSLPDTTLETIANQIIARTGLAVEIYGGNIGLE